MIHLRKLPNQLLRKINRKFFKTSISSLQQLSQQSLKFSQFNNNRFQFSKQQQNPKPQQILPTFSQFECKQLITEPNPLLQTIIQHISKFGQMKLDKYWNIALTDSQYGYYRQNQNVFSKQGDFTTSPQISPLFGEMVAVWIAYFLAKTGVIDQNTHTVNKKFRLVEFGPGRGLLMKDIVKSLHDMKIDNHFDISFIQGILLMIMFSQLIQKMPADNLFQQFKKQDKFFRYQFQKTQSTAFLQNLKARNSKFQTLQQSLPDIQIFRAENQEFNDITLKWYPSIELLVKNDYDRLQKKEEVPLTIFVMNQFFDALPTTVYQFTEKGWREKVLVRSVNSVGFPLELKTSNKEIPQKLTPRINNPKIGDTIEISHQSLITMDTMAKLLLHTKGAVLNIDYGGNSAYHNSIRAIKQHKFIPEPYFWQIPGKCDLSAYVNFGALGNFAQANFGIQAFEPIPQGFFLQAMGINPRIQILQKNMNKQQQQKLQSEYNRLVHPQQMGQNFKVQCITLKQYGQLHPWIEDKEGVY